MSIYDLQRRGVKVEQMAKDVLRDLPPDTPQSVRTMVEVIEAEARMLVGDAESLRSALRPLVDG